MKYERDPDIWLLTDIDGGQIVYVTYKGRDEIVKFLAKEAYRHRFLSGGISIHKIEDNDKPELQGK